jgi:catechol 2,3-dioxygenase-like lactoylglutathione lyase family enzyme
MPHELSNVRLRAPARLLPALASFYGGSLGLPLTRRDDGRLTIEIGESVLELAPSAGSPFYHFAFLVPGDRFDAALAWARDHVELLRDAETGEEVFDFTNWDAEAVYFHDPAGSIVELIAHHGIGETGATGTFSPHELLGLSEVGLVCDPPSLAEELERDLGLEVWDGTVEGEGRLAFVGEKARTLILCRAGRTWLPTGRPAEAHPVEVTLAGASDAAVLIGDSGRVSVKAS